MIHDNDKHYTLAQLSKREDFVFPKGYLPHVEIANATSKYPDVFIRTKYTAWDVTGKIQTIFLILNYKGEILNEENLDIMALPRECLLVKVDCMSSNLSYSNLTISYVINPYDIQIEAVITSDGNNECRVRTLIPDGRSIELFEGTEIKHTITLPECLTNCTEEKFGNQLIGYFR